MGVRVEQMYAMYRGGASLRAVGEQFGISGERVRQLFGAAGLETRSRTEVEEILRAEREKRAGPGEETPTRIRRPAEWVEKKYSDAELLEILRTTSSELGGILTAHRYDEFAIGRTFADRRPWPSHQTHFLRFGSWRGALLTAGLPANPSSPISGQRIFGLGQCVDAVRHVRRELGQMPSVKGYETVARRSNGALPSAATVRNRCGSWSEAVRLAATP
jgi:hypothetical protein